MSSVVLAALLGWLIALVIFLGFIALLRYIDHRERMALIARGMDPNRLRRHRRGTGVLRSALRSGSWCGGRLPVLGGRARNQCEREQ